MNLLCVYSQTNYYSYNVMEKRVMFVKFIRR